MRRKNIDTRPAFSLYSSLIPGLLLGVLLVLPEAGKAKSNFVRSETLGVLILLQANETNDRLGRNPVFREILQERNGEFEASVEANALAFETLSRALDNSYPIDPITGKTMSERILEHAAKTETKQEFFRWLKENIRPYHYMKFTRIYNEVEPAYTTLVKQPNEVQFSAYLANLHRTEKRWNEQMPEIVNCAGKFLRSSEELRERSLNSKVSVYPLPAGAGGVDGQSFNGMEMVGFDPTSTDLDGDFSVVIHEKVHSLFNGRSQNRKDELMAWLEVPDEGAEVYGLLDEALGTVIGNVWAYEKATGKKLSKNDSWYKDPKIDAFSKALADEILEYLKECKPMDRDFAQKVKAVYEKVNSQQFPDTGFEQQHSHDAR